MTSREYFLDCPCCGYEVSSKNLICDLCGLDISSTGIEEWIKRSALENNVEEKAEELFASSIFFWFYSMFLAWFVPNNTESGFICMFLISFWIYGFVGILLSCRRWEFTCFEAACDMLIEKREFKKDLKDAIADRNRAIVMIMISLILTGGFVWQISTE